MVDDSSTDQTADIAVEHGARVVRVQHRQIAATRNAGALQAHGDVLFFVDADTLINEAVVKAAIESVQSGAVGGGCRFRFDGRIPLYARLLEAVMFEFSQVAGLAAGCFLFCTREAFERVNGFDAQLYAAEEIEMSRALRRLGKFVILRETAVTSGRKLRTVPCARFLHHCFAWFSRDVTFCATARAWTFGMATAGRTTTERERE